MELAARRNVCPVCSGAVIDLSRIVGGRPREYCSVRCRRIAERRRRQKLAARRWAQRLVSLPPEVAGSLERLYGREGFARHLWAARELLGIEEDH